MPRKSITYPTFDQEGKKFRRCCTAFLQKAYDTVPTVVLLNKSRRLKEDEKGRQQTKFIDETHGPVEDIMKSFFDCLVTDFHTSVLLEVISVRRDHYKE